MAEICAHCGTELPSVGDAFCPQCGGELEVDLHPRFSETPRPSPQDELDLGIRQLPNGRPARPLGVYILAILQFATGIGLGGMLLANFGQLRSLGSVGLDPLTLSIAIGFLSLLGITSGIGLVLRRKWGWWLGVFYNVYGIARSATSIVNVALLQDVLIAESARGPIFYYVKYSSRLAFYFLFVVYFFRGNVLTHFGLEDLSKSKVLSGMVAACLAMSAAGSIVAWLASKSS